MRKFPTTLRAVPVLIAVLVLGVSGVALASPRAAGKADSGIFRASIQQQEGKELYVAGNVKDKRFGRGAIVYVTIPTGNPSGGVLVKAKRVTIYFGNGTLAGTGSAVQNSTGATTGTLTGGTFNLNHGTGAYKGHSYKGTFAGTQKDSTFTVNYKGTYK